MPPIVTLNPLVVTLVILPEIAPAAEVTGVTTTIGVLGRAELKVTEVQPPSFTFAIEPIRMFFVIPHF